MTDGGLGRARTILLVAARNRTNDADPRFHHAFGRGELPAQFVIEPLVVRAIPGDPYLDQHLVVSGRNSLVFRKGEPDDAAIGYLQSAQSFPLHGGERARNCRLQGRQVEQRAGPDPIELAIVARAPVSRLIS